MLNIRKLDFNAQDKKKMNSNRMEKWANFVMNKVSALKSGVCFGVCCLKPN